MRFVHIIFLLLMTAAVGCNVSQEEDKQVTPSAPPLTAAAPAENASPTATQSAAVTAATTSQSSSADRPTACVPRTDWQVYTVTTGDTLGSIAQRAGTTVSALSAANCLANADLISVGQQLRVPITLPPPTSAGPPTANPVRVGGQVSVSPVLRTDSGWLVLRPGSTVTISWPGAERLGAVEVYFEFAPTGTGITPLVIGEDHDTSNGVSFQWVVPTGAMGHLSARAGTLGGRVLVDYTETLVGIIAEENSSSIQISSFTVSPDPVRRGGTLFLSWMTVGAAGVSIIRYSERGSPISESWGKNLPANGSLTYALSAQEYFNHISFDLRANPDQATMISRRAEIELICPFSSQLYVGCPITQQTVTLVYQPFERGHMIWRRDARKVFALLNDGRWHIFADTWAENEPVYPSMPEDGSIPCPSMRPQRGLGKVWFQSSQPGILPSLRDALGCPTSAETSYESSWEEHRGWMTDDSAIVINAFHWVDGRRLILDPASSWALPPN